MPLNLESFLVVSWVLSHGLLIGTYEEGSFEVEEYHVQYSGYFYRYRLYYEYRRLTWTTPAGEIRPCTQKTRLLTGITSYSGSDCGAVV